jgi:DNA-binding LytR/AlgR family response regulator
LGQPLAPVTSSPAPLSCIVVDDDPIAQEVMERYADRHPHLAAAGSFSTAEEAAEALDEADIDLVVLDIEMPGMSGIELADLEILHGLDTNTQVIFVTAKEDYALQAFSVDATDYLVKPVRFSRFDTAIQRVQRRRTGADDSAEPEEARSIAGDTVFVKVDGRYIRLELQDILWIEAQGDYMLLKTVNSRYMIHSTLKTLAEKLPDAFARVHRSFIVRIDQIKDIEDTTLVIDGKVIPIGASYRDDLMRRLNTL